MQFDSRAVVLVLSDDPRFVTLVRAVADDATRVVRETNTGSVLSDLAHGPRPDVLVLDVTIGTAQQRWALLEKLSTDPWVSRIPIVVTPSAPDLLLGHAITLQGPGLQVWSDPFDPADLLAAIERVQWNPGTCG
ncbi:MAG TPA: response regulator [Chloroflexota bacterium]|jgi:CheY-like chemotaxis protein